MGFGNVAGVPLVLTGFGNVARAPAADDEPEIDLSDLLVYFGTDLGLWFDALDLDTLHEDAGGGDPPADEDPVGQWEDKSTFGLNAVNTSPRPSRLDAGINGHRALQFNGSGLVVPAPLTGLSQCEVWLVASSDLSATQVLYETYAGATTNVAQMYRFGGTYNATVYGNASQLEQSSYVDAGAGVRIFRHRIDTTLASGGSDLEIDGSHTGVTHATSNDLASSVMAAEDLCLGSRNGDGSVGLVGKMGELVLIRRLLTSGEAVAMFDRFDARWA